MSTLLDVKNLGISFGGLRAVNDFDLKIQKEELYGLIGPKLFVFAVSVDRLCAYRTPAAPAIAAEIVNAMQDLCVWEHFPVHFSQNV